LNPLSKYDIPFVGLKNGEHHFFYSIDDQFFDLFEQDAPVSGAKLEIDLQFDKESFFQLAFNVDGTIKTVCDRCAEDFDLPVGDVHHIIVKFDDGDAQSDDPDIIYIARTDTHLNVANLIYEFIVLSVPLKRMHPDGPDGTPGCKMGYNSGEDESDEQAMDPRWAALKGLK